MGRVVAFANMKGGVGKTTCVYLFATGVNKLFNINCRVLVVDLDPQANLTLCLVSQTMKMYLEQLNISYYFADRGTLDKYLFNSKVPNVDIIPSFIDLALVESRLHTDPLWPLKLKTGLDSIREHYDIILVDCPPNIGSLTVNGIVAADDVLVPVTPDTLAMRGFSRIRDTVQKIRLLNQDTRLSGIVINMLDRRYNSHITFMEMIKRNADNLPRVIGPITRRAAIARALEGSRYFTRESSESEQEGKNEVARFIRAVLEIARVIDREGEVNASQEENRAANAN